MCLRERLLVYSSDIDMVQAQFDTMCEKVRIYRKTNGFCAKEHTFPIKTHEFDANMC